jgi:short-subunit dehydrogenase
MAIAIVGAGPGIGQSLARQFGRHGFAVGLVARDHASLDTLVAELRRENVEAVGIAADVLDRPALSGAIAEIASTVGPIHVLEYGPMPDMRAVTGSAASVTAENAQLFFDFAVLGAATAVEAVLPHMLEDADGALLFTTGLSAMTPMPRLGNLGIAMAALRSWVYMLHEELAPKGIYAGTVCVGGRVARGSDADPDVIARVYYDMYSRRDRVEELIPADRLSRSP